jgi:UDP-N-acetylmuramoyl-tripeptide--D-alanyl-D-alanine ligase
VDAEKIAEGLSSYQPVNNRSQWHDSGKNKIVMDAYNANPSSMELAITNFSDAPYENKMVILGDMRELGEEAEAEHQHITELILESSFEQIILVGEVFSALKNDPKIKSFKTVDEAKQTLKNMELSGRTILLKGSRGIQLEKLMEVL